ncbi:MAG: membrane protein, partial [Rhodospirillaceae bacterium BRH_c57]
MSNIPFPETGRDAEAQKRGLRRHRMMATGLLVVMIAVFIVTVRDATLFGTWTGLVQAAAEAALIGGLADWFAVTALFRRPLGLPIPHTGIIPRNKDRIGRRLGQFVTTNFLAPDLIHERMRSLGIAARAGGWLADPNNARRAAGRV